jgi:predicted nucleotidyltransferase
MLNQNPDVNLDRLLKLKREEILQLAAKHGAHKVRIFGSVARGEADASSDIDFLVEMEPDRSLFDLGGLLMDLQELLGCKVMSSPKKAYVSEFENES